MGMSAYTRSSRNNPTAIYDAMKDDNLRFNQYMKQPGYQQMSRLYDQGMQGSNVPNYMDKWASMASPADFMGGFPGMGGSGSSGPIGAEQLAEFGEGAYELFDKFKPGMEYIAENQGVSEQELSNRLGVSSAGLQENIADQEAQHMRRMGRMGIDPSSGAWQAGANERTIEGAKGLSGLQQQVRQDARGEDWQERLSAAGIGLNVAGQGTNALSQATSAYNQALGTYGNMYGNYIGGLGNMAGIDENARQYDKGYMANLAQGMTGAGNNYMGQQTQFSQMNPWTRGAGNTGGAMAGFQNKPNTSGGYGTLPSGLGGTNPNTRGSY